MSLTFGQGFSSLRPPLGFPLSSASIGFPRPSASNGGQSCADRDRDRQREQQRKQRAQMLPDDKETHAGGQDLFHAPVKVRPSVEDNTTVQIRNSLGNFESIKHLMTDPGSSKRLQYLVGVDQGSNPGTPSATHRNSSNFEHPSYRHPSSTNSSSYSTDPTKNHYPTRNPYNVSTHASGTFLNNHINHNSAPTTSSSSASTNSLISSNNFRGNSSTSNPPVSHPVQPKVPLNQNPHSVTATSSSVINSSSTSVASTSNSIPPLSTRSPNLYSNNQVRSKPNPNYSNFQANSVDFNVDGASGSSTEKYSNSSQVLNENSSNNTHSVRHDKSTNFSKVPPSKKPVPERADSQLEVESILKEMTDITPPLTAIQTPIKESKKPPPRRSSKAEEKLQSIINSGMAKVPSPVQKMDSSGDSSSSYDDSDSNSDSESEDSSSGSHLGDPKPDNLQPPVPPAATGSPNTNTTKWDLGSILQNKYDPARSTKPCGAINHSPRPFGSTITDSFQDDVQNNTDRVESVTSTVTSKAAPVLTTEPSSSSTPGLSTRAKTASRTGTKSESKQDIPPRQPTANIPNTSITNKISSLTASSSDEDDDVVDKEKKKKSLTKRSPKTENKKLPSTKKKRTRTSSQTTGTTSSLPGKASQKATGDSSPEEKNGQDKNKTDTIRKLFRTKTTGKNQSPSKSDIDLTKSSGSSHSRKSSGKGFSKSGATSNGDIADVTSEKKKDGCAKDKSSSHSQSKKHSKSSTNSKSQISQDNSSILCPPPKTKEDPTKSSPLSLSASSLIVRIPLDKLRKKPPSSTTGVFLTPPAKTVDKEIDKLARKELSVDPFRLKISPKSNRVGSSSDTSSTQAQETSVPNRDEPMCSDSENDSGKTHGKRKPKKRSKSSPKKAKIKKEDPDSHTKVEEETYGEVSSNVSGYNPCDSVSVSTTITPPTEMDVQAPDSSLNPPHLPSPFIPVQLMYYSYFEKTEPKDDLFTRDQDSYLEEAKKLKHSADNERSSTTQASMYLEAGLYFILTGILMERDINLGTCPASSAPYTMYRDTLTLIQYIGNRWRSTRQEANIIEARIITLSMRCQALLSLKLFKLKMRETKEVVHNMNEFFAKGPSRESLMVSNSPQLSTPSPHSPTSSPIAPPVPGLVPPPPPPSSVIQQLNPSSSSSNSNSGNHVVHPIPRALYSQIHKQCSNIHHVVMAHDTWEQADSYVFKYHLEEFFLGIDRQFGPLTLHSSLTDLVRYVRHGLQLINPS